MDHGNGDMPRAKSNDGQDMGMPHAKSMMHMTFFWGKDVEILFSGFPGHKLGLYVLALCFVFVLSVFVEAFSVSRAVKPGTNPTLAGVAQAGYHALRMGLAYLVMLSVMSFNGGIFLVAVAGHAVGYFIFRRTVEHQTLPMINEKPISISTTPHAATKV